MNEQAMPILHGDHLRRSGVYVGSLGIRRKMVYRCKDGYVSSVIGAGLTTKNLIDWLIVAGYGAEWMKTKDWGSWTPGLFMKPTEEDLVHITDMEDRIERFFLTMTKDEIYAQTLKRRLLLAPVATEGRYRARRATEGARIFREGGPHGHRRPHAHDAGAIREAERNTDRGQSPRAATRRAQRRNLWRASGTKRRTTGRAARDWRESDRKICPRGMPRGIR